LVWDICKKIINSFLKHINRATSHISYARWQQVEQSAPLDTEITLPGSLYCCRSSTGMRKRDSHPTTSAIVNISKLDMVPPDQALRNFPEENDDISLSAPFLRIKMEKIQPLPMVKILSPSNIR
jgi:hypothetical protein